MENTITPGFYGVVYDLVGYRYNSSVETAGGWVQTERFAVRNT